MSGEACLPWCSEHDPCFRNGCHGARFGVHGKYGWLDWLKLDSKRNGGQHDVGWTDNARGAIRFSEEYAEALAAYLGADARELPDSEVEQ